MKACLSKLGLKVSQDSASVPSLSRLHLSAMYPADLSGTVESLKESISSETGEQLIKGENDTFLIEQSEAWSLGTIKAALPTAVQTAIDSVVPPRQPPEVDSSQLERTPPAEEDKIVDYDAIIKRISIHTASHPESKTTPYFNHAAFYANLDTFNSAFKNASAVFGRTLLYGEVVTSTNTLLEK